MHHISTKMTKMEIKIHKSKLKDMQADLKNCQVKHNPFKKAGDYYIISIITPESAHSLFLLKYCS